MIIERVTRVFLTHFRATVKSNGSPYAVGLLSCLSITLVYCDQTAGSIRIQLDAEVGLIPAGIVLDGDPAAPTECGTAAPHFSAQFALARSPISATAELLYSILKVIITSCCILKD